MWCSGGRMDWLAPRTSSSATTTLSTAATTSSFPRASTTPTCLATACSQSATYWSMTTGSQNWTNVLRFLQSCTMSSIPSEWCDIFPLTYCYPSYRHSHNDITFMETDARPTSFPQFRVYCLKIQHSLSLQEGYSAQYKILKHPFAKEHDGQYLVVNVTKEPYLITINLTYSIAYQLPLFYFMVYNQESQPLDNHQIYHRLMDKSAELQPDNNQSGIFLSQQPITGQYFYTLHHCDMKMPIQRLVPFYFSLLHLHPPLIIEETK